MKGRVHPFSYSLSPKDNNRDVRPFQRRDVAAAMELQSALVERGFMPGESILNPLPYKAAEREELLQVDMESVGSEDLILLTTRPPIDDVRQGDRKQVRRGFTDLEHCVFTACRPFIAKSSRSHIILEDAMSRHLQQGFGGLAEMVFSQKHEGARFQRLNSHDGKGWQRQPGPPATAAFLLHVGSLWDGGPGLLCAFGMDGIATLGWAYLLRHRLPDKLEGPRFLVARLGLRPVPRRPTNLRWAEDWDVDLALDCELPAA